MPSPRRHAIALAALLTALGSAPARTATVSWTGPANAEWASGSDGGLYWSGGQLPGPDDDVVVGVAGGVQTIGDITGFVAVRSLNSNDGLALRGSELDLAAASRVGGMLSVGNAVLDGSGSLSVDGAASLSGSTVSIALRSNGSLVLGNTSLLAPLVSAGSTTFISGSIGSTWSNLGSLNLQGSLDMTGAFSNEGSVVQNQAAVYRAGFVNSGAYNAGGSFSALAGLANSGSISFGNVQLAGDVVNSGTITMSDSAYTNALGSTTSFRNEGLIRITGGQLAIQKPMAHYGRLGVSGIDLYVGIDGDGTQSLAVESSAMVNLIAGLPIRNTHLGGAMIFNSPWSPTLLENVTFDDGGATFRNVVGRGTLTSLRNASDAGSLTLDGPGATLAGRWTGTIAATAGTTVTIAPGSFIDSPNVLAAIDNHGTLSNVYGLGATLNEADGSISMALAGVRAGVVTNHGRVAVTANGPVFLAALRDNTGSFEVGAQSFLFVGDTTLADLARIVFTPGARLGLGGMVDNAGPVFDLRKLGAPVLLSGASLSGSYIGGSVLLGAPPQMQYTVPLSATLGDLSIDSLPTMTGASIAIAGQVHSGTALVMNGGLLRMAPGATFDNNLVLSDLNLDGLTVAAGRHASLSNEHPNSLPVVDGAIRVDGRLAVSGMLRMSGTQWTGVGTTTMMAGSRFSERFSQSVMLSSRLVFEPGSEVFHIFSMQIVAGGEVDFERGVVWSGFSGFWVNQGVLSLDAGVTMPGISFDLRGGTLRIGVVDTASFASVAAHQDSPITLGGRLDIEAAAGADWKPGDRFVIVSGGPVSGRFDVEPDPARWQVLYGATDVTLVALSAVPEPSARWLAALGVAALLLRRRPVRR